MDREIPKAGAFSWKRDSSPELVSCLPALHPSILFSLLLCLSCAQTDKTLPLSLRFDTHTEIYVGSEQKENTNLCEIFHLFTKWIKAKFSHFGLRCEFFAQLLYLFIMCFKTWLAPSRNPQRIELQILGFVHAAKICPYNSNLRVGGKKHYKNIVYGPSHAFFMQSYPTKNNVLQKYTHVTPVNTDKINFASPSCGTSNP